MPYGSRGKDDFYPTPPEGVNALLSVETFDGPIWEPACGDGAISKILEARGHSVISTDLVDRGYGTARIDFLMEYKSLAPNIVTNPPFKLAGAFVRRAIDLEAKKIAVLAPLRFLEGVERQAIFQKHRPARVWVFSKRLTIKSGEVDGTLGGMLAFAWFIWDDRVASKTELGWL